MKGEKSVFAMALVISLALMIAGGCGRTDVAPPADEVAVPVKTATVHTRIIDEKLHYVGLISHDQLVKQSFKVQGRILNIEVTEGEAVQEGQILAAMEPIDLDSALEVALGDVESAKAQLKKTEDALEYARKTSDDMRALFNAGAVSKQQYDRSVLSLDLAGSDYNTAVERLKQAQTALEQTRSMRAEAIMVAPFDGTVIQVLSEAGEIVGTGQPVIVVQNGEKVVQAGVTQADFQRIEPGMTAEFWTDGRSVAGQVRSVNSTPDPETRTYQMVVDIDETTLPVGTVGDVQITVGKTEGVLIPIRVVLSSGSDYVYVVRNGRAYRIPVELGDVAGTNIYVEGLEPGENLVIEGMKNLKPMSLVKLLSE